MDYTPEKRPWSARGWDECRGGRGDVLVHVGEMRMLPTQPARTRLGCELFQTGGVRGTKAAKIKKIGYL